MPLHSRSNWKLEMLVFEERENRRTPLRRVENNKLNPNMAPGPGIEPGTHW